MKRLLWFIVMALSSLALSARADVSVDTENLQLQFSPYGDLLSVRACLRACGASGSRSQYYDSYRGLVTLNRDSDMVFELERQDSDAHIQLLFTNQLSDEVRRWQIPHSGWLISLETSKAQTLTLASGETFIPPQVPGFGGWMESLRYVFFDKNGLHQAGLDEQLEPWQPEAAWLGYRNRFWAAMIRPAQPMFTTLRNGEDQEVAQIELAPVASGPQQYLLYAGPVEPAALASAHRELGALMYAGLWAWLRWICQALFALLVGIHALVPNWAVAIMLMSLVIQALMQPLNRIAERLQQSVRDTETRISPRLHAIKKAYKGAEQAEKILALYKEEKVHPLYSLKSLAGVMVIIPVFIGAFNMLSENIWLAGASFAWIQDLSRPDAIAALPVTIPFLGGSLNLLPFIMIALSVPASMLHDSGESDPLLRIRHTRRLWMMSAAFFLLFYTFPAAMVLYWVVNNAVSLAKVLPRRTKAAPLG